MDAQLPPALARSPVWAWNTEIPWFHQLFTAGRFRGVGDVLLRGAIVTKNMQYFNKPPRIGQPTPPHQDGYYFMLNPYEAVTMWLALPRNVSGFTDVGGVVP